MVNFPQFAEMHNEASIVLPPKKAKNFYDEYIPENMQAGEDPIYIRRGLDRELYKDYAFSQRTNLGVKGGGNIAKYYIFPVLSTMKEGNRFHE